MEMIGFVILCCREANSMQILVLKALRESSKSV